VAESAEPLLARLRQGAPHLLGHGDVDDLSVGTLVSEIGRSLWADPSNDRLWLALVVMTGSFPEAHDVHRLRRTLGRSTRAQAMAVLLSTAVRPASADGLAGSAIRITSDRAVVDVDFCARHGHNSGIQRVVRETVSRWSRDRDKAFELVAWTNRGSAMRELRNDEEGRVLDWTSDKRPQASAESNDDGAVLIVPWQTTVILPEVAREDICSRLAALAQFSGNRVSAVGYDTIPIVSAQDITFSEANRFAKYLWAVKYMDRVLSISASAGEEFAGFANALAAQGLVGPQVAAVSLPVDTVGSSQAPADDADSAIPLVLSVGTQEPRKNQVSLMYAAERLWREGYVFELMFIGGIDAVLARDFDGLVDSLRSAGRTITVHRHASDELLRDAYARARFSAFISLHEGFGLPVGESLAYGTPVLTSDYGSVAEIARDGGCFVVDPRDDDAVVEALRRMLDDDELISRLSHELKARIPRTWHDYAHDLWRAATAENLEHTL
jgi:glycosyltransferase involved in cell wall biosynthesis